MRRQVGMAIAIAIIVTGCSGATSPGPLTSPASSATVSTAPSSAPPAPSPTPAPSLPPGVIQMFDVSYEPSGIVAGDDLLWAEDHARTNRVYAVDPETGEALTAINISRPCDVVATDDRVWVADLDAGRLVWIDPDTREIGGELSGLSGPCGLLLVDDTVWFAVDEGLGRIDPGSGEAIVTDLGGGVFPGSGAPFWAAKYSTGDLIRIDSATGKAELTVPHPGGQIEGPPVASGFDSVWAGGAPDRTYRLDSTTGEVEAEIPTSKAARLLVADEGVWLTSYDNGVVERIDPETNEVEFRAELGGNINGITEGLGGIWVTDTGQGRIYQIDPEATGVAP